MYEPLVIRKNVAEGTQYRFDAIHAMLGNLAVVFRTKENAIQTNQMSTFLLNG